MWKSKIISFLNSKIICYALRTKIEELIILNLTCSNPKSLKSCAIFMANFSDSMVPTLWMALPLTSSWFLVYSSKKFIICVRFTISMASVVILGSYLKIKANQNENSITWCARILYWQRIENYRFFYYLYNLGVMQWPLGSI